MKSKIEKAFISFRIGVNQWISEKRFKELLDLFEKYKGVTDEITFFTSYTHAPLPLEVIKERANLLTKRLSAVRKIGYRTGINILATLGHNNENLPNSLSGNYTPMTDIKGNIGLGSFCPNDEKMRGYIKQLYEIIVSAEPDYIWIDDDVRLLGHRPIWEACFCENCLRIFEKEYEVKYTRKSLQTAFNTGPLQKKLRVRKAWLEHNCNTIARLFELIEKTVHGLKPDLPLGYMTGEMPFEGNDFDNWAKILSGPGEVEVKWRPGGGFYADDCMKELIGKSHEIGRQVSLLPDSVISIQSEVENYTYQRLKKAAHTTALEATSHIAAGCTGAAFNVLSMYDEPLDEYEPLMVKLCETRAFFDLLVRELGRTKAQGIYTGWTKNTFAANNIAGEDWLGREMWKMVGGHANEILEIGLPACYSPTGSLVTVLSGDGVLAMKEKEILRILSSGVYMDAQALNRLNEMGYEKLTGFSVERFVEKDCIEEFVNHSLNTGFFGRRRDGRQSFWRYSAAVLKPQAGKAEILARMVDYGDKQIAPCCMGVFENHLGGRFCVAGYYPWTSLQNLSKSTQMKSLMRWLSKDTLPAYVSSFHKVNLWVREPERGRLAMAVINSSLDRAENVTLTLLSDKQKISVFDMKCSETRIASSGTDGAYRKFTLPPIEAWQMRFIVS